MNTIIFSLYAGITLVGVLFFGLREFHMLQLNGYKTPEHSWWMKKNYKRYIFPLFLFVFQFLLLFFPAVGKDNMLHKSSRIISYVILVLLTLANMLIISVYKPGKTYKKPLVFTARMKRMMTTFFVIVAVLCILAYFGTTIYAASSDGSTESFGYRLTHSFYKNNLPFILIGTALYLTPLLVPLSNIINKPIEKAIQNWYINDAKKILDSMPDLHKVGITGSYGKTSMKFYLSELLASQYETLKTPESFNTPMGVTITVRTQLKPTHEYFVCEMGARRVGEIAELCSIANPHDGIITSVGPQHLETFGSIENVANTKFELADSVSPLGKLYLNGDNEIIRAKAPEYPNAILYGMSEGCDYRAENVSVSHRGTEFTVVAPNGESCRFSMKLLGEHSVLNVTGAIAYCHGTGIPLEQLVLPVKRIAAVPHRLQLLDHGNGITYIDDAYNSNPSGCRAALSVLGLFEEFKILVTPGMVELGAKQEELNFEFGQEAAKVCDFIVLVGRKQTAPIYNGIKAAGFDMKKVFVANTLNNALAKVQQISTDKKKIVLLENDLPDNY